MQKNMKIVFLDIDGVLNCQKTLVDAQRSDVIDSQMVMRLNTLIADTNAKVVLSSTWRLIHGTSIVKHNYLIPAGFKGDLIDETPNLHQNNYIRGTRRGCEIQTWLDNNAKLNISKFVILDDNADMDHLLPFLVQTCFHEKINMPGGLQNEHVIAAKKILEAEICF